MTNNVIADFIEPSDEILGSDGSISTENLLDEVNLYNLYDTQSSPEQNAQRILDITYPTHTLIDIIEKSTEKLDSSKDINDGAHIIGGEYGTGKSHIELVVYHLLTSPEVGQDWIDAHDLDIQLPVGTQTAALQMLNLDKSYNRLWEAVGAYLEIDDWVGLEDTPRVHDIRDVIADQPTAVMIDEFERWFRMQARVDYRDDNLAFLQNLLEAANRDDTPLVVHVSLLYQDEQVEGIVPRTNPFLHDLSKLREEKIEFILHRLIGDVTDPDGVANLAKEYTDVYRNNKKIELDDYDEIQDQIKARYPFHPATLRLLIEKFSEQETHQDARGLLDFLTKILADNYNEVDLILTGDIDVFKYLDRFRYIDSELAGKYENDHYRLQNDSGEFDELVEELLNMVFLHSLTRGGEEGTNQLGILLGLKRKGSLGANEILHIFNDEVYGNAWHIHKLNGEYTFHVKENPSARIQKTSEDIHKDDALHRIESLIIEDLFDDHNNVYILDPVNNGRSIPDNKHLKIVVSLAAKQKYDDAFEALTTGQNREFNNTLVLFTPQKLSGIDTNTGIIELGRKVVAGERMQRDEGVLPEGFNDIHDQNYQNLRDRVRDKYGTAHIPAERGLFPKDVKVNGDKNLYQATIDTVKPDSSQVRNEVRSITEDAGAGGILYEHLLHDFYRNPGLSTLTDEEELRSAVKSLCMDGVIQVGPYFGERVGSLGSDTDIVHNQFVDDEEEDAEEEKPTITIDARTATGTSPSGTQSTTSGADDETSKDSKSSAVTAFECPECGSELESNVCECGFEFDATDVEEGRISVEGVSIEEMLDAFGIEEDVGPIIRPVPAMGTFDADNKPDLIDKLERQVELDWEIYGATIDINATLTSADLGDYGINAEPLDGKVSLNESFEIGVDEPISRQEFLSLLYDWKVPEKASFDVKLQVDKNE